jgi:hypothetical protein
MKREVIINTRAGQSTYTIEDEIKRLLSVHAFNYITQTWMLITPTQGGDRPTYKLHGSQIILNPAPDGVYPLRLVVE